VAQWVTLDLMETWIFVKDEKIYLQAGAGIVADSDPRRELEEVDNKIKGMIKALELASRGLELYPVAAGGNKTTFNGDNRKE